MTCFIHPSIEERRDNPDPRSTLRVVVVCEEDKQAEVHEHGAEDGLGMTMLDEGIIVFDVTEAEISTICEYPGIDSIAPDEVMKVLG